MPRKIKKTTETLQAGTDTMPADAENHASSDSPVQRPGWIDGSPVDTDGQFIREGSPRQTAQMELAGQSPDEQAPDEQAPATGSPESDQPGKNWGDPYKSIFSCPEVGFELGEHRRFKQRVFLFTDKPTPEILDELKEQGFIYRAAEKAWTIPASPSSRKLTDDLARKWAGPNYIRSIER